MLKVAFFQFTGKGKVRCQDALFNGTDVVQVEKQRKPRWVETLPTMPLALAVADGIYQSPNAHLASKTVMKSFARRKDLALREIQQELCDALSAKSFGASTTFAGTIIEASGDFLLRNVGDSRIYHIDKNGFFTQLSHDHTVLNDMRANGLLQEGVEYSDLYQIISSALVADYDDDCFAIHTTTGRLQTNEALLLCTDGLTDGVLAEEFTPIWQAHDNLLDKLEALRLAVRQSTHNPLFDDCSVICVINI